MQIVGIFELASDNARAIYVFLLMINGYKRLITLALSLAFKFCVGVEIREANLSM